MLWLYDILQRSRWPDSFAGGGMMQNTVWETLVHSLMMQQWWTCYVMSPSTKPQCLKSYPSSNQVCIQLQKKKKKKETADLINYVSARVVNDYSLDFEWAASLPVWEWQKHARQRRPRLPRHLSAGCVEMRVHGKSVARACVCVCWSEREWDQVTLRIIPLPPPPPTPSLNHWILPEP